MLFANISFDIFHRGFFFNFFIFLYTEAEWERERAKQKWNHIFAEQSFASCLFM